MPSFPNVLESEAFVGLNEDSVGNSGQRVLSERTDRQLVDVVLAGDISAFEQLFDRHKHLVAKIAGRYFREPSDAEEIIQITFAKAYVELERFRGTHEFSLAGWLRKIAVNACIDTLRSRKRRPEGLCCELSDAELNVLASVSATQSSEREFIDRDLIEKLLAHLEPEDRALMQMLYTDDMSVAEIGGALGWSGSKVKIRAWRARRSLRKLLDRYL